ncbi:peptidyl-prolyl cis-trans isomerase FKBP13, chloroplastic [Vitis riparia]|uniref:peptidyl-prolyl cis-trans isomerase FKBP13, chloroplastic n=1 Tax=Vitis riparia TaxID=96939 RepID=UPI00155AD132|nr:peptidyl-prolyl cis-trans isomerase FKBP13, chloroplastic [Vitis riparia]
MSSLAFSLGYCTPIKLRTSSGRLFASNVNIVAESRIKILSHQQESPSPRPLQINENSPLFGRREAIGFGFCFSLLDVFLQAQPSAAAQTAPCELTVAPSGLAFCDKVVGTGPEAVKGQLIKAHYVGKLESGKVFDSSYDRGKPLTFRIGVGEVIRGWDQGILGGDGVPPMLAGGKRTLKLPPEFGYGTRGAGCRGGSCIIPPDSVLLFDVEFIGKA